MKRKTLIFICCVLTICAMTGCQLAREDAESGAYEDRLIGIFVTTEHLDLFDFEGYLNDNLKGFQGGEIKMDGNTQKYQGRVYAELVESTVTSEETGESRGIGEYVFSSLEGISFFAATVTGEGERCISTHADEGISDIHSGFHILEEENRMELEGTLYVLPGGKHTYYINPVYQDADGNVYVTTGSGISSTSNAESEGGLMSQSLEASYTVTENGKTKTDITKTELSIKMVFAPVKIVVLQMNAENSIVSRTEYVPGDMPEFINPEVETEYLIVETQKRDISGGMRAFRELYGKETQNIETFRARNDGICVKHATIIEWK